MDNLIVLLAFAVFGILWLALAGAFAGSQGSLDAAWRWIGLLPLVVRLALVAILAAGTLSMFLPRWLWEGRS
jgi:hypothetical protein